MCCRSCSIGRHLESAMLLSSQHPRNSIAGEHSLPLSLCLNATPRSGITTIIRIASSQSLHTYNKSVITYFRLPRIIIVWLLIHHPSYSPDRMSQPDKHPPATPCHPSRPPLNPFPPSPVPLSVTYVIPHFTTKAHPTRDEKRAAFQLHTSSFASPQSPRHLISRQRRFIY